MTRSRTERLALSAMFCALAMILSYIEAIIPFDLILPVPGFKLGLANIAVSAVFLLCGPLPAACVSITRIFLSALLFGSVTSFWYSICGGMASFAVLIMWKYVLCRFNGYVGLGVMSAAAHNIGQCTCAVIFFGPYVITAYLPVLLLVSLFTGAFTGILLSLIVKSGISEISGHWR